MCGVTQSLGPVSQVLQPQPAPRAEVCRGSRATKDMANAGASPVTSFSFRVQIQPAKCRHSPEGLTAGHHEILVDCSRLGTRQYAGLWGVSESQSLVLRG